MPEVSETRHVVSDNIQRLRGESGKSRAELGALCGIGRMFIYEIENEMKSPSLETLSQIAQGLSKALSDKITPSDLHSQIQAQKRQRGKTVSRKSATVSPHVLPLGGRNKTDKEVKQHDPNPKKTIRPR